MASNSSRLQKKAIRDQQRRIKPGECEKYVRVVIDTSITLTTFGRELIKILEDTPKLIIQLRDVEENCIFWERNVGQREFISDKDLQIFASLNDEWIMENQVIKIFTLNDLKYHVKNKTLLTICKHLRTIFPNKQHTLIVPRFSQSKKDFDDDSKEIERSLVDIQVLEEMTVIQVPSGVKDYATIVSKFTKAIAEALFKQQKSELMGAFNKYVANDNKQCVRVESTNGLGQLWQQHLSRLPMVTLEIAETIKREYDCPKRLIEEYKNNMNTVNDIANLRINRTGGPQPLHTERRIGNALSMKLYTLYNSRDPNACI